jgi:mannose-6-phosphate isomerase-like protein (cupin superfamily)
MPIVNLKNKFGSLAEYWTPETFADIGNVFLKLVKVKGDYVWHKHEKEDKLYMVMKGKLRLKFRDARDVVIDAGEFYVVPKNTEHQPIAADEAHVVLIEPKSASLKDADATAIDQIFIAEVDYLS